MYSREIEEALKKGKIRIGDRVKVVKSGKSYEGLLMPRTEAGDPSCMILKVDSGYNIGIEFSAKSAIEKSHSKEPKDVEEEEKFELGEIRKSLLKLKFDSKKPPVCLIATGGTVAARVDYKTGGVTGMMDPREFLHNVPELANIVNMKDIERPFTKMSEDMNHEDWEEIAKVAARRLNSDDRGVIITHGTDALHFTAAALSFFLRNLTKPVVLAGAQRSSDRGSSDAGMNIICSSHAAVSDMAEVGICMHGSMSDSFCLFLRGTKVRKMHTSRRDAFRPVNELPLAKIWPDGRIEKLNSYRKRSEGKVELDTKFEPRVVMLKVYPGSEPDVMNYYVGKGYKGFVLEGMGLGHVPVNSKKSWTETIKKLVKGGIPVVVTSQTLYGRINPDVYTNLRILFHEAGAIPGEDMLPETAYVKLGWVLGHTKDFEEAKKMMLTNYAGEITERTLPETFLY